MKDNEIVRIDEYGVCRKTEVVNFADEVEQGGTSESSQYPAIEQGGDLMVRIHCDKILEKLIAAGADVDVEAGLDENYNGVEIGLYYTNAPSSDIQGTLIYLESNSDISYQALIRGFEGQTEHVTITETQQAFPTVREVLEKLGTIDLICNTTCHVFPFLRFNYQSTGCHSVVVQLTLSEYLEFMEFNLPIPDNAVDEH